MSNIFYGYALFLRDDHVLWHLFKFNYFIKDPVFHDLVFMHVHPNPLSYRLLGHKHTLNSNHMRESQQWKPPVSESDEFFMIMV